MNKISDATWAPPWETETWQAEAHTWIDAKLANLENMRTGDFEQFHIRAWSTVIRIPTKQGDWYFKAGAPVQAFEPGLVLDMNKWAEKYTLKCLAVDSEKGWMLLPDGGETFRQYLDRRPDIQKWEKIVRKYSELQIESNNHLEDMLAAGCYDRRLAKLMGLYRTTINDVGMMGIDEEDGLKNEDHEKLLEMQKMVEEKIDKLGSYGLPEGIEHGDLHDANVLVKDGHYTFFDWGDASVSHPFFSMVVAQRSIAYKFSLEEDSPELDWLRDAYLAGWRAYGNKKELIEAYKLAQYLGRFQRAINWYNLIKMIDPAYTQEDHYNAAGWLGLFLDFGRKSGFIPE